MQNLHFISLESSTPPTGEKKKTKKQQQKVYSPPPTHTTSKHQIRNKYRTRGEQQEKGARKGERR